MGFKGEFRQWSIFCGLAIEILLSSGLWQSSSPSVRSLILTVSTIRIFLSKTSRCGRSCSRIKQNFRDEAEILRPRPQRADADAGLAGQPPVGRRHGCLHRATLPGTPKIRPMPSFFSAATEGLDPLAIGVPWCGRWIGLWFRWRATVPNMLCEESRKLSWV
jgi:hypothetical protein